jgi:hypothetical protein
MRDPFETIVLELDFLPTSEELIDLCSRELADDILDEIREMELDPSDTLGCLWAECLEAGYEPEEFFRRKGIIQ